MRKRAVPLLLISLILLSSAVIQIPLHNRNAIFNDEGIIFNISESVLNGGLLYKDVPSYTTPFIFYFLALLYKIFGVSFLVSRYAMAVVFSATAVFVFLISRKLMEDWLAFVMAVVFVAHRVWAFNVWNMIGYSTFAIAFLAVAVFLLLEFNRKPRLRTVFLVGIAMGVVTMFKQDYGGLVGIGVLIYFILWPKLRETDHDKSCPDLSYVRIIPIYVLGGLMVGLPYFAYLLKIHAFQEFLEITFLIPLTLESTRETTGLLPIWPLFRQDEYLRRNWFQYAPTVSFIKLLLNSPGWQGPGFIYKFTPLWDMLVKLMHYSPYICISGVAGHLISRYRKGDRTIQFQNMSVVTIVSFFLFLTQHQPFDYAHLMQMYMPVFFLIGYLISILLGRIASRKWLYYAIRAGLGLLLFFYIYNTIMGIDLVTRIFSTQLVGPRAGFYMREADKNPIENAIEYIQENTSQGEPIFVLPYHSLFYFLAERPNPTRFQLVWPIKIFPTMDQEIIDTLEDRRVNYIVRFNTIHPGIGALEEIAPDITAYVRDNYVVERKLGGRKRGTSISILKRKADRM